MCSWCYAFDRVLRQIEAGLPKSIKIEKILGGLAPDSIEVMPAPMAAMIERNWQQIEQTVAGVRFNFDFWKLSQAMRSTYPSCRAVLAAKTQGTEFENKMIAQIQSAYYQNAKNPSLDSILIKCAKQIGLNVQMFESDYGGELINELLLEQIQFSRSIGVSTYPSLCLEIDQNILPIMIDYNNADYIVEQILKVTA